MSEDVVCQFTVGMVHVNCPACGESCEVDVRVGSVSTANGSYFRVQYQGETVTHRCVGRRS